MKKSIEMPKFKTESEEADWWSSRRGRGYVKQRSASAKPTRGGSRLVTALVKKNSVQIAIRLAEDDLAQARKLAAGKGIGYQTLIKMLVHEGLQREARR